MTRPQDMASADLDIRKYVIRLAAEVGDALGERLAGLYVHGSLATGSFFRSASDIDVLVLVKEALPRTLRDRLDETLRELNRSRPTKGEIEVTVVQQAFAKNYEHPLPVELQFNSKPSAVPAQLLHAKERSVRLVGDEAQHAIGPVPWYAFMDAVVSDFDDKASRIETKPVSVVLNACRTLHDATSPSIRIVSKVEAAQWALAVVPKHLGVLVRDALEVYREDASRSFDPSMIRELRAFVEEHAVSTFEKVRDTDE
ncbi:MAG: aminoglycoside adenylyltransferase domain-containing protein [Candidatus Baltobacteraceae bacterium]